jgi:hypothetical protein
MEFHLFKVQESYTPPAIWIKIKGLNLCGKSYEIKSIFARASTLQTAKPVNEFPVRGSMLCGGQWRRAGAYYQDAVDHSTFLKGSVTDTSCFWITKDPIFI